MYPRERRNMKARRCLFLLLLAFVACQKTEQTNGEPKVGANANQGANANAKVEQIKRVSFTLFHRQTTSAPQKPFAGEEIAVFPVVDDKIRTSNDNRLGLGKTDPNGHATIEFRTSPSYSEYVLVGYTKGSYMMLRNEGNALSFQCDKVDCNLGNLVFDVFEFSGGG
jgi:hypothetical protein